MTEATETMRNAVALVYLKYDGERIAPGTAFKVKESHVEELKSKGCAEIDELEETPVDKVDQVPGDGAPGNADGKEGEKEGE